MSSEIRFSQLYVADAGLSRGLEILCSPAAGSWSVKTMFVTDHKNVPPRRSRVTLQ
ncbi:MAG: hypothetical protein JWL73_3422 [Actinomycetia bacterium]|nr:hypothetical protein [Actinomycetes bacterium]